MAAVPETIDSSEALVRWLEDKPPQWARAIALRAALRVFPLVTENLGPRSNRKLRELQYRLVIHSFRAAVLANTLIETASNPPDIGERASLTTLEAAYSVSFVTNGAANKPTIAAYAAQSVAYAVATHFGKGADCAHDASRAADYAASAAGDAADARDVVWGSIQADLSWLEDFGMYRDTATIKLERQPLWLIDFGGPKNNTANFPIWTRRLLDEFERNPPASNGPWGLIVQWYRELLPQDLTAKPRSAFGKKADLEIASKDEEFWSRDPDDVMADIADIVGWPGVTHEPEPINVQVGLEPQSPKLKASVRVVKKEDDQRVIEEANVVADGATRRDLLEREPFAIALAERINDARRAQLEALKKEQAALHSSKRTEEIHGDGFAVHLHAPWGAGKTSILKMMEDYMTSSERPKDARWVIVNFNAWRHERRNPPWWPLMEAVYRGCRKHLSETSRHWSALDLRDYWQFWKFHGWAGPYAIAIFLLGITATQIWNLQQSTPNGVLLDLLKTIFAIFASATTAFGAFAVVGSRFVFGSKRNADTHVELSQDSLKRVKQLFETLIKKTSAPVCVFIDDLDRCDSDYVIRLLEGVQTAFRNENVVYVVAADKLWIKAAFETHYDSFNTKVSKPGQPLGYLFLEKIFQMSVPVPGINDELKKDHVNRLATGGSRYESYLGDEIEETTEPIQTAEAIKKAVAKEVESLEQKYSAGATREDINRELEEKSSPIRKAAAAKVLNTSRKAEEQQIHLLRQYAAYLPDIPRQMVRMINAFTLRNIVGVLENDFETSAGTLARWTVLEQRYPAVADILIDNPEWTTKIGKDDKPESIKPFAGIKAIQKIIGGGAADALTEENIRRITRGSRS